MIRQLLRNGQVTLPKEAVKFFHLREKDPLDIHFDRSGIHLKPLVVDEFTEEECEKLVKKLKSLKREKGKVFHSRREAKDYLDKLTRSK